MIPGDLINDWVLKGEVTPRYYNPENLFQKIVFLLDSRDHVSSTSLQLMSGEAEISIHYYTRNRWLFLKTFGYRPFLVSIWANHATRDLGIADVSLIRTYGLDLNLSLAISLKSIMKCPAVLSTHVHYGFAVKMGTTPLGILLREKMITSLRRKTIPLFDETWAVYSSILDYLRKFSPRSVRVIPNVVSSKLEGNLRANRINSSKNLRIISVGRLIPSKSPEILIRVLNAIPNITLTIVGDGPLRFQLESLVSVLSLDKRVLFIPKLDNAELIDLITDHDIGVIYSQYRELSKAMIEFALNGIPTIVNIQATLLSSEFNDLPFKYYDGSEIGLRNSINELISNGNQLEKEGCNLRNSALRLVAPSMIERRTATRLREIMEGHDLDRGLNLDLERDL